MKKSQNGSTKKASKSAHKRNRDTSFLSLGFPVMMHKSEMKIFVSVQAATVKGNHIFPQPNVTCTLIVVFSLSLLFLWLMFLILACGGTFHMERGTFNSPNFPEPYPPNTECVWNIPSSPGNRLQLSFT